MALRLQHCSATQHGEVLLDDVNLIADPGEISVLIGRTGSGKTSVMRAVAGLLALDEGTVQLGTEDLTKVSVWKRDVAMVYQQFINYPNRTVRQNVEFPLKKLGLRGQVLNERVDAYLGKVGLTEFAGRRPGQLSGGQQQRVALARSLARQSRILMLDEPLMNLDFKLREQLREEFLGLFAGESQTVTLYATTEIAEAMMLGNRLSVLHEGRIVQHGTPADVFDRPLNRTVAQTVSDPVMSFLRGQVLGASVQLASGVRLPRPGHLSGLADGPYEFGLRANDIVPSPASSASEDCLITFVEISGSETVVHLQTESGAMIAQVEGIHDLHVGERLSVTLRAEQMFAFTLDGNLAAAPSFGVI